MTSRTHQGGCACGAVRYTAIETPKFIANCHCADCRRATAAAYSTYAGFDTDQVRWSGSERGFYMSSSGVKRGFCPQCGTPLSYEGENWAGESHLFLYTFDDPSAIAPKGPSGIAFEAEKLPWIHI